MVIWHLTYWLSSVVESNDIDQHIVYERRLGPGYRFLVRAVVFIISAAFFLFAGMTWVKLEHSQNTTEVLKLDSIIEAEIRQQDEELRIAGKEFLKNNRPYDDNGIRNPEWVQYLDNQRAIARARANGATLSEKSTYLLSKIKRVWD